MPNPKRLVPHRRWIVVASTVALSWIIARVSIALLDYAPRCDQPCSLAALDSNDKSLPCEPLELRLHIGSPLPRARRESTVFYRLEVVNRSCELLEFSPDRFIWNLGEAARRSSRAYLIDVEDHFGTPINQLKPEKRSPIALYKDRPGSLDAFASRLGARRDKTGFLRLLPGDSVSTAGAVLSPHKFEIADMPADPSGRVGSGYVAVTVPAPVDAVPPPEGFTALTSVRLPRPGRYRVSARLDRFQVWVRPAHPLRRFVPGVIRDSLALLGVWNDRPARRIELSTRPTAVEIEVSE